ncbi:multidrug effflux MFS transporter [Kitasatospora viridis]
MGLLLILVLGSLSAMAPLSMDMYLPALPRVTTALHTQDGLVQLTLTSCMAGLALGQLVAGPLSDSLGRRRPLLVGLVCYVLSTAACAVVPDVRLLIACRLVQGLSGATGIVIARAIVRDLFDGLAAARFQTTLMMISGSAPLIAPIIGGQLLRATSWRGVFVVLTVLGLVQLAAVALRVPETLPRGRRHSGRLPDTLRTMRGLLADRLFTGYLLTLALGYGTLFAFLAGSPYVLQEVFKASPQQYSLLFALIELGLVLMTQVTGRVLLGRFPSHGVQLVGVTGLTAAGTLLVLMSSLWHQGLWPVTGMLCLMAVSLGVSSPPSSALALQRAPQAAGTASALVGTAQFLTGAVAPALVGLGGHGSALPMGVVILGFAAASLLAFVALVRPWQRTADPLRS